MLTKRHHASFVCQVASTTPAWCIVWTLTERNGPAASNEDYKSGNTSLHPLSTLHPAVILHPPRWIHNMLTAWTCYPNSASSSQPRVSLVVFTNPYSLLSEFEQSLRISKMCFLFLLSWVKITGLEDAAKTQKDMILDRFWFIWSRNKEFKNYFFQGFLFLFIFDIGTGLLLMIV